MFKKILAFCIAIIMLLSLCGCDSFIFDSIEFDGALNVHFIDVGQGDSILLESGGVYVLVDAGERDAAQSVCDYLDRCGVKKIDYVITTHPHSDHCGGLTKVINRYDCINFITTETDQQTNTWLDVLHAVDENDVNYIDAKVGDTYSFGESSFEIMGPVYDYYEDYNNHSVVIKATCGNNSFLLTGDAESLSELEMINNGADLDSDVLKVSHHGSSTSSAPQFLNAVSPKCAIISCGKNNDYGHPHVETVNSLNGRNIPYYRTDKLGSIVISSDKQNLTIHYGDESHLIEEPKPYSFVGNKNSKKFHISTCEGANKIKESNKVYFDSYEDAINGGYTSCNTCRP